MAVFFMLKKFIDWWLYSSCMAAICALSLAAATLVLLHISLYSSAAINTLILIGSGTLLLYNLHYLKKSATSINTGRFATPYSHYVLISLSGLACLYAITKVHYTALLVVLLFSLISLYYSHPISPFKNKALNQHGMIKPYLLTAMWTLVPLLIPALMVSTWNKVLIIEGLRRFVFILPLCFAFDWKDRSIDFKNNVFTLAAIKNKKFNKSIIALCFIAYGIINLVGYLLNKELPDFIMLLFVGGIAYIMTIAIFTKNKNELYYLGIIDGMMFLYGLAIIFVQLVNQPNSFI